MERITILAARRYDFTDKDSGRRIEGITVQYITGDQVESEDQRGAALFSIPAPLALWPQLQPLPATFEAEFRQRPGLKGKPTLQLVDVRLLEAGLLLSPAAPVG